MSLNPIELLLEHPDLRRVFSVVARQRSITFRELVKRKPVDPDDLQKLLDMLVDADLLEMVADSGPLKASKSMAGGLDIYQLTSTGFEVDRKSKRID